MIEKMQEKRARNAARRTLAYDAAEGASRRLPEVFYGSLIVATAHECDAAEHPAQHLAECEGVDGRAVRLLPVDLGRHVAEDAALLRGLEERREERARLRDHGPHGLCHIEEPRFLG